MPVTHQEIADEAGVSRALVTRALHRTHGARVSLETRMQILEVAKRLGYEPRGMTTRNIGYVGRVDALCLLGENRFLLKVDRALRRAGYRLLLTTLDDDEDTAGLRELLTPRTVDGVIFTRWFDGRIQGLLAPEVPWVVVADDDRIPAEVDQVTLDTITTAERLTEHLMEHGHRRIGLITNPSRRDVTSHLKNGIQYSLAKAGIGDKLTSIEVVFDTEIIGHLRTVMRRKSAPTAFIIFGAEKTITTLSALSSLGYQVPRDVSVVTLQDHYMLESLTPPVTATTAFDEDVAERAVERLLEKLEHPEIEAQHIALPGALVQRGSVAAIRPEN